MYEISVVIKYVETESVIVMLKSQSKSNRFVWKGGLLHHELMFKKINSVGNLIFFANGVYHDYFSLSFCYRKRYKMIILY